MSGAPKAARSLSGLPGERALHGKEPFGLPQEAIPYPNRAPAADRRGAGAGRRGRGVLLVAAGAGRPVDGPFSRASRRGRGRRYPAGPRASAAAISNRAGGAAEAEFGPAVLVHRAAG